MVMEGLSRLEYRGYDSAGFACLSPEDNRLVYARSAGHLDALRQRFEQEPIDGFVGIGHTRWATHGGANAHNAHPHFDCEKRISVVHNGIIENHSLLRDRLQSQGHVFHSETDTEIIAHILESLHVASDSLVSAMISLVGEIEGSYAFIGLLQDHPDTIIAARKGSPLCIGIGDGEMFIASDVLAFAGKTSHVLFLPDKSFALITATGASVYHFDGTQLTVPVQEIDVQWTADETLGHEHHMIKEIYEQKQVIHTSMQLYQSMHNTVWECLGITADYVKTMQSIHLVGCGTSWNAACIARHFFESVCMLPTRVHLASEFRYMPFFPENNTLFVGISQSGETADTLEALRLVNNTPVSTVALTNVASSTMVRECGGFLLTKAGQEVAVASTKAFTTQLAALYWLAHRIALEKGIIGYDALREAEDDIHITAEVLENAIENYKFDVVHHVAPEYAQSKHAIFLGRHVSYPFAQEAALKLKELAYVFADAYPAGELKHGPLALVDSTTPVFVFSHTDPLIYQKLLSNTQEVKARSGQIIAFAFEGQRELIDLADAVFVFPRVKPLLAPLAMSGLMQFLVYHIANVLDRPIDKPRNLAKSVTVE